MTTKRIYTVNDGKAARLIRAANVAQARNHAARATFAVAVASQDDLIALLKAGVEVEEAGAEPVEQGAD